MNAVATQSVAWFNDIDLHAVPRVGGKGASLGELRRAGIAIPDGFVLTTDAFRQFVAPLKASLQLEPRIAALQGKDTATLNAECAQIRDALVKQQCPADLQVAISAAYQQLSEHGKHAVAVRSSATSEDSADASFAGLQDTYLWVRNEQAMLEAVKLCWASLYNAESVSYRLRLGLPEAQLAMAVVIQRMVNSRCSGVMFTRSPLTGDRSVITLEGSWGLGSSIVSGEVTPDKFVVNKITREITRRDIATKQIAHVPSINGGILEQEVAAELQQVSCLSDEQIHALADTAKHVERHYGKPQDIEWALDQDGHILLLQSRPETVWANKEKAPVAKPAAKAFDHIFKVMGGHKSV
ncbi:MAG TPA: PEP/pyruvate-binding domain-containing protein [Candidatus Acidoferrum sp.]|nr:PEP/pyruvate-binding domain-containing protein [Candidatus Acidoferrum sp.]